MDLLKRKPTAGVGWVESTMINEAIKKALEDAQHELTTLHNLTVTDNIESGVTWVTDVSSTLKLIDDVLNEL